MANRIKILDIAPLRFVPKTLTLDPRYHVKHFDNALAADQIFRWEEKKYYAQKYQNNDELYWQIVSNYGPISARLLDSKGNIKAVATIAAISSTFYTTPEACYGCGIDLTGLDEGGYQVEMIFGAGGTETRMISEVLYVKSDHPDTLLFEFSCQNNEQGAIFQHREVFSFRVEGALHNYQPGTNDVVFEDEPANLVRLSATPFDTFKLSIGGGAGVPDWVVKKLNKILACDTVLIDGRQFVKPENAKWEKKTEDGSPLSGWSIDLRPAKTRNGLIIENDIPLDNSVVVVYVGEQDLFGPLGAGTGNIIKVE